MLVQMEDKDETFSGSRDWIGSVEVALVLDYYCNVPGKILHVKPGEGLGEVFEKVRKHFSNTGCPVMMGGDMDASSKGVFGACETSSGDKYFLILDPHFVQTGGADIDWAELVRSGWAQWVSLDNFSNTSFYNLCLPQVKL